MRQCVGQPGGCLPDVMSLYQLAQKAVLSILQDLFEWSHVTPLATSHPNMLPEPRKPPNVPALWAMRGYGLSVWNATMIPVL